MQERKFDEAILQLQKALEWNPNADEAHGNIGLALMQEGRLAEASAHLQRGLEVILLLQQKISDGGGSRTSSIQD
jgi:Flp pilus assembly protein TadD